jgi:YbbR domain-containing protein
MEQKNTWIVKVFCIVAAFSLWIYISNVDNNQITQRVYNVAVIPVNENAIAEKKLVMLPDQQLTVTLNVKGTPTDISLGKNQFRVLVDFGLYGLSKGEMRLPVIIDRQPANVTILNAETYFVKVQFDNLIEKSVPVKLDLSGKVKEGYYSLEQKVSPTDVIISGPARYVNEVVAVRASGDLKNADKDLTLSLPLRPVDTSGKEVKNVIMNAKDLEVTIPVKKTKTVSIIADSKGSIGKDMFLKNLIPIPEKVDIAGDESVINSITSLKTEKIDLGTLTPDATAVTTIILPPGVRLINSDGTVKVKAVIEKIIDKTISVDIGIKNLNDNFTAALGTTKASIVVSGTESQIGGLKESGFAAVIDLANLNSEGEHTVDLKASIPEGVNMVSINPQAVKVTLKKKETAPVQTQTQAQTQTQQ